MTRHGAPKAEGPPIRIIRQGFTDEGPAIFRWSETVWHAIFGPPRPRDRYYDESQMKKGGVNERPDGPRPTEPPKPQSPVWNMCLLVEAEERQRLLRHEQRVERSLRRIERALNARHRDRRRGA